MSEEHECGWCGEELSDEEHQWPRKNTCGAPGEPICDECFHEHYEFTCDKCQSYELEEFQHIWLVVHEKTKCDFGGTFVLPGVFEIVEFPYYGGPMIGQTYLFRNAVRRTKAKVTWGADSWYPCGHLCRECAGKLGLKRSRRGLAHEAALEGKP